jgi:tetratricopeptide (TPR) repeat protein
MGQIHKTIFISYRRTNQYIALSVYKDLTQQGYDCFLDYRSISSGDWLQVILNQVRARAHFLLILTPTSLERCTNTGDILRQEIEAAVQERRNVIPLLFENADLGKMGPYLVSTELKALLKYNALPVPEHGRYFDYAMQELRRDFLNVSLDMVLHPIPRGDEPALQQNQQAVAASEPGPQLTAREWYAKGYASSDFDEQIRCYSEAIRLKPDYADAYYNRGNAYHNKQDYDRAIADYNEALRIKPDYAEAYVGRGLAYDNKQDYDRAIADYNQALRLKPDYALAYNNRGLAYYNKQDYDRAIADYDQALRIKPDYAAAYVCRGVAYNDGKRDYDRAIADYNQALRIKPDYADAYINRGVAYRNKQDYDRAIADYDQALRIKPDDADAYNNRGNAYYAQKDYDRAIADYNQALRINPNYQLAKDNLALARKARGD